jgi:rsbT co-antagonist protein RsbR
MNATSLNQEKSSLAAMVARNEPEILEQWLQQMSRGTRRSDLIKDSELRAQCAHFLSQTRATLATGSTNFAASEWNSVRELLTEVSQSRAQQGFTPSETATFILSMKKPLFEQIRKAHQLDGASLAAETWVATELLDAMALFTTEVFQKAREYTIKRQQEELLELSTPVVKLWEGILALPIIGTLDSARTQIVMESLLQAIVQTNSRVAIIDITGVPTVDTVVAQHLLKTVTAARLMGADCIISGVRPQIAQTIVHLGINLLDVTTKATLAAAFKVALDRTGIEIGREPRKA